MASSTTNRSHRWALPEPLEPDAKRSKLNDEENPTLVLRALGFCGVDDTVDIEHLRLINDRFGWIEWGVLFRPDKEGQPRYATDDFVKKLCRSAGKNPLNLAAHLCGRRVTEVLQGDTSFVAKMFELGFRRFQVNATKANGVDVEAGQWDEYVQNFLQKCVKQLPEVEWILQKNEETRPLWEPFMADSPAPEIVDVLSQGGNVSVLFDSSCGFGIRATSYENVVLPSSKGVKKCGYAGGISADNVSEVLCSIRERVSATAEGNDISLWIDMESSLRSNINGKDSFDLGKCFRCASNVECHTLSR